MHKAINLNTGASQPAANNVSLALSVCPSPVGTTVTNYSSPTSSTPIERKENEVENKHGAKDGHSYVIYACDLSSIFSHEIWYFREVAREMVDAVLAITQRGTKKLPPPTDPVAQDKPFPPIPPRIVGSKRKFVEDRSTYSNSINPARKKAKLPYVLYFTMMHMKC